MKYYKKEIQDTILKILEGIDLEHFIVEDEKWKMSVFFSVFNLQKDLERFWQEVSSTISSAYQGNLKGKENEFEKWNIYIIYVCREEVSKELKNLIENDKFSSRKIVEDKFEKDFNYESAEEFTVKHIMNNDLVDVLKETNDSIQEIYIPVNENLWKLIPKDESISGDTSKQKELIQLLKQL